MHRYLYAYANPTAYYDPNGRQTYSVEAANAYMRSLLPDDAARQAFDRNAATLGTDRENQRQEFNGLASGSAGAIADGIYEGVKFGGRLAAAMLFDVGGEQLVEDTAQGIKNFADPELLADRLGTQSAQAEAFRNQGKHFEAGETWKNEGAAVVTAFTGGSLALTKKFSSGSTTVVEGASGTPTLRIANELAASSDIGSAANHIYSKTDPLDAEFPELVGVNPHYVEGAGPGVNTNCVSCANAAQQRLLGINTNAVAEPSRGYGSPNDLLPSAPFGFEPPTTPSAIQAQMAEAGHGSVGVVRINQGSNIEHVINVANKKWTRIFYRRSGWLHCSATTRNWGPVGNSITMDQQQKSISIVEATKIAEAAARLNLQGFLTNVSVALLRGEILEAEHCWMFFRNPEICVPTEAALRGDWAYVVSRYGEVRDVADLYGQEGLTEHLKKMSDYFGDRRTRSDKK